MSLDDIKPLGTEKLTAAEAQKLADDKTKTVLQYVYDTPEAILASNAQLATYCALLEAFDARCRDDAAADDETLREHVLNRVPGARLWQRLYAKTFANTMQRATTAADEEVLDKTRKAIMVFLVERAKGAGTDEDKAARAQHAALRLALRQAKPEDYAQGQRLAAPDAALPAELESLKPMDPRELGPSAVRQKPEK